MKIKEIKDKTYFAYVAPDGEIQLPTIAEDPIICEAYCKMLSKKGLGLSPHQLNMKGFTIQPILLNIRVFND